MKKKQIKYYAWALLLGALLLFIVGGFPLLKQIALDAIGTDTTGTVVDVLGDDRNKVPIVQFTTASGQQVEFKSNLASNAIKFSIGEQVEIQYLASMPQIAEVTLLGRINYPSNLGSTCLGLVFLMGGIIALRNKPLVLHLRRRG